MAETNIESNRQRKSGRALRWLGGMGAVLALLLVAVYFLVTNGAFLKGVVLPRVSAALGVNVTATEISIRPFSQILLKDLKVQPRGQETLLTAAEARARYHLTPLLRGQLKADEITLSNPVVRVVKNADGTSNLDALLQSKGTPPEPASGPSKPRGPLELEVKNVTLRNGTVQFIQTQEDGRTTVAQLAGLNFTAAGFRNGQTAQLQLDSQVEFAQDATTNQARVAATIKSRFDVEVGSDAMPRAIRGAADFSVTDATGAFADAAALNGKLAADLDLTEIRQLAFDFAKGGAPLGAVTVSGPFDALKQEGKLRMKVTGIGNELLSLAGGRFGIYFGSTRLAADYEIEFRDNARFVSTTGTITGDKFSLTRNQLTTPAIDFQLGYNATLDLPRTNATVRALTLNALQAGRPLLKAELSKEMRLDWGKGAAGVDESTFALTLKELNLADWKPFLGEYVNSGIADGQLLVSMQKAGRLMTFDLNAKLAGLSGQWGSNHIDKADLTVGLRGQMTEYDQIDLSSLAVDAARLGQPVAALKGSGRYLASTRDADFQTELTSWLAPLSDLLGQAEVSLTGGTAKFAGHASQKNLTPDQTDLPSLDQRLAGKLQVMGLTGHFGGNRFDRLEVASDVDVVVKDNLATIRKCDGFLQQASQPGGSFDVTGSYHLTNEVGQVTFTLTNLNQNVLRSLVDEALAPMSLDTISINAALQAGYDPKGDSTIQGEVHVAKLVVKDPTGAIPATPLEANLRVDAAARSNVANIRQALLTLSPTPRAANRLQIAGQVDFNRTNATTGNLRIDADSLDVTRYGDLFFGHTPASSTGAPARAPGIPAEAADQEPKALTLPLREFIVDARVQQFYWREVEITNFIARAKLDARAVQVKPFELALNGAPVSATADLDLGVPGFTYDLEFQGANVPLAPLVNSLTPDQKDQIGGTAAAVGQFKGAGITEANLAKNLTGQFDLTMTNLNLAIEDLDTPLLKTLVDAVIAIPDLIRNPAAGAVGLVRRLVGADESSGGFVDEMTSSPINHILVKGAANKGRFDLQQGFVASSAFQGNASGIVTLAAPLTNSTLRLPLQIALRRSLADRIGLAGDTPTNMPYAKLPDFVTLKGTLGESRSDFDRSALVALAAKAGATILGRTGSRDAEQAAGVLGAVGNLIGGGSASKTNTPTTDKSGADLLGTLNTILGGGSARTNIASTNTPPATNTSNPLGNLLDLLRKN